MAQLFVRMLRDEDAQDLTEYTLLLAFVCFFSAGLYINSGVTMHNIWGMANNTLSFAQATATS